MAFPKATLEDVITAVRTLHGEGTREQKKAADIGLRRWQQSFEAWSISDQLLSTPCPYEVQHMAALTLRTKIIFDITQLPPEQHEALCTSLLGHVRRYKNHTPQTLLTALGLAFADLTIHMATAWTTFIDALCQQLSEPQDVQPLLLCLKLLPEENLNYSVLADPAAREAHAKILKSNLGGVVAKLNSIIETNPDMETTAKVLECFIEWVSFAETSADNSIDSKEQSLLSGTFLELCLKLLKTSNPATDDTVAECLTTALSVASRSPSNHHELLQRMLHEISSTNGIIRNVLSNAFIKDDADTVLRLARVYRFTGIGNAENIAVLLHKDPELKELLPIMIRLTAVPFDVDDEARGLNGIAAQMFEFWEVLAVEIGKVRKTLTEKSSEVHSGLNVAAKGMEEAGEAIEQQNSLFEQLIRTLVGQCLLPKELISDADDNDNDFYQFRSEVCSCINRISRIISQNGMLQLVIQLLTTATQSNPQDYRIQEGHLACICRMIHYLDQEYDDEDECYSPPLPLEQHPPVVIMLVDLLSTFSGTFLISEPPTTLIECYARTAVAELIGRTASKVPLHERPELIPKLLECLGQQVFQQDLLRSDGTEIDRRVSKSEPSIINARRRLSDASSDGFRSLCVTWCSLSIIQELLPNLMQALYRFEGIVPGSHFPILEGIAILVGAQKDDAKFLKATEDLFNPIIAIILSNSDNAAILAIQLDRISLILRNLCPEGTSNNIRREALGAFLSSKLWPLVEHLLTTKLDLTEKCCRVLKHGMRCVRGDVFKSIVPALATLVVNNSRNIKVQPTYLYVAEWLIVQYCEDQDICPNLKILFNELSALALRDIEKLISVNKLADESYVVEDLFGMFCRYFRFCPTIPGTSPSLELALDISYGCIQQCGSTPIGMILSMIGNMAYVTRECEDEEGGLDQEATRICAANLQRLFRIHFPRIIIQCLKVIESVPPYGLLDEISRTIFELRKTARPIEFEAAIRSKLLAQEDGVEHLPAAVLSTPTYKETIIQELLHGRINNMLEELYGRCRQVNLRQKEAEVTNAL